MNVTNLSMDEIENAINEASAGAYFILKEAYQNKELPAGKAIKLLSRLSLLMTGSAHFGDLNSFAVFYGELIEVIGIARIVTNPYHRAVGCYLEIIGIQISILKQESLTGINAVCFEPVCICNCQK